MSKATKALELEEARIDNANLEYIQKRLYNVGSNIHLLTCEIQDLRLVLNQLLSLTAIRLDQAEQIIGKQIHEKTSRLSNLKKHRDKLEVKRDLLQT